MIQYAWIENRARGAVQLGIYSYWLNELNEVKFSHHDWVKPRQGTATSATYPPVAPTLRRPNGQPVPAQPGSHSPQASADATALVADPQEAHAQSDEPAAEDRQAEAAGGSSQAAGAAAEQPALHQDSPGDAAPAVSAASKPTRTVTGEGDAEDVRQPSADIGAPAHLSFDADEELEGQSAAYSEMPHSTDVDATQ